jgi:hypothetical protein
MDLIRFSDVLTKLQVWNPGSAVSRPDVAFNLYFKFIGCFSQNLKFGIRSGSYHSKLDLPRFSFIVTLGQVIAR